MPNPRLPEEVLRVSQQSNDHNVSMFYDSFDHQLLQGQGVQSSYYITKLKYSKEMGKLVPYKSVQINKPLLMKTRSKAPQGKLILFTSLQDEVFFFSKNRNEATLQLNIMKEDDSIVKVQIDEDS